MHKQGRLQTANQALHKFLRGLEKIRKQKNGGLETKMKLGDMREMVRVNRYVKRVKDSKREG